MKNSDYDIIMVVIASRGEIYDEMINCYWSKFIKYVKKNNYRIKIFMLFGNDKLDGLSLEQEDVLFLNNNILVKTLESFEYINNNYEYKNLLRTNLSSFFIVDELIKVNNSLNNSVYAGYMYWYQKDTLVIDFISGAGIWLSRDNITYILDNKDKIEYIYPDDVAIGKIMEGRPYNKLPKNYYITGDIDVEDKETLLSENIIKNGHYHIRVKNEADRSLDIKYMKAFTDILYEEK